MGRHRELWRWLKQKWLEEFLALPNGIPSDDTFRRVFEFIDPQALNRCFLRWVETLVSSMGGEIIPIDGKTIRGSYDRNQGKSALHLISAWVPIGEEKRGQGSLLSSCVISVDSCV
jgi:hypothetical protein